MVTSWLCLLAIAWVISIVVVAVRFPKYFLAYAATGVLLFLLLAMSTGFIASWRGQCFMYTNPNAFFYTSLVWGSGVTLVIILGYWLLLRTKQKGFLALFLVAALFANLLNIWSVYNSRYQTDNRTALDCLQPHSTL